MLRTKSFLFDAELFDEFSASLCNLFLGLAFSSLSSVARRVSLIVQHFGLVRLCIELLGKASVHESDVLVREVLVVLVIRLVAVLVNVHRSQGRVPLFNGVELTRMDVQHFTALNVLHFIRQALVFVVLKSCGLVVFELSRIYLSSCVVFGNLVPVVNTIKFFLKSSCEFFVS
jgi:hypothetical protein